MHLMQIHKKHKMNDNENKFVTLRISSEVHRVVKGIAALEEKGLQEYIEITLLKNIQKEYPDVYKKFFEKKS